MYPKNNKGFAHVLVLILVVLGIGTIIYRSLNKGFLNYNPNQTSVPSTSPTSPPTLKSNKVDGWQMYRSQEFGYEVSFPSEGWLSNTNSQIKYFGDLQLGKIINTDNYKREFIITFDPHLSSYSSNNSIPPFLPLREWVRKENEVPSSYEYESKPQMKLLDNTKIIGETTASIIKIPGTYTPGQVIYVIQTKKETRPLFFISMEDLDYQNEVSTIDKLTEPELYSQTINEIDQILSTFRFLITKEEAENKVKNQPEILDLIQKYPKYIVEAEGNNEEYWTVHVYEVVEDHTATYSWYHVDIKTGDIEKVL